MAIDSGADPVYSSDEGTTATPYHAHSYFAFHDP
jgi:hypothetical protein